MFRRLGLTGRRGASRQVDRPLAYYVDGSGSVRTVVAGKGDLGQADFATPLTGRLGYDTHGLAQAYVSSVWAYRCVLLKAQAVGKMPWRLVEARTGTEVPTHQLRSALRRSFRLFRKWAWSLDIWGETFLEKVRDGSGRPVALTWLNPMGMDVDTSTGHVTAFNYMSQHGGEYVSFEPEEIVFSKTDNPFDDLRGLSPLVTVLEEVAIDRDLTRTIRKFYMNDARPGVMIIPEEPIGLLEAQRFIEWWKENYQGPDKTGKPVYMPYKVRLEQVQRPPSVDDVTLRESLRREIAASLGVPLSLAGAWDDAQYQSLPVQRQSFYEETIIPLCTDIAKDVNSQVVPFFDPYGSVRFEFVFDEILALSEQEKIRKSDLALQLSSGGITLNEYRQEIGKTRLETGDVLFMPSTVVATPIADLGKAPPQPPPEGSPFGMSEDAVLPDSPVPPRDHDPLDELRAWERKALSKGVAKAMSFKCHHVPDDVADVVRLSLTTVSDRDSVRSIFAKARDALSSDDDKEDSRRAREYWRHYDDLLTEVGDTWLRDYMVAVGAALSLTPDLLTDAAYVESVMASMRDDLIRSLVGTPGSPGPMTRLYLAGMAAGVGVLEEGRRGSPVSTKADPGTLTVDWDQWHEEAYSAALTASYGRITDIDKTTMESLQDTVSRWIASGESLSALTAGVDKVFHDEERSRLIAQTESTRMFSWGAVDAYKKMGVRVVKFFTVRTGDVCPICEKLHGTELKITDTGSFPPLHPGCRCYVRASLKEVGGVVDIKKHPSVPKTEGPPKGSGTSVTTAKPTFTGDDDPWGKPTATPKTTPPSQPTPPKKVPYSVFSVDKDTKGIHKAKPVGWSDKEWSEYTKYNKKFVPAGYFEGKPSQASSGTTLTPKSLLMKDPNGKDIYKDKPSYWSDHAWALYVKQNQKHVPIGYFTPPKVEPSPGSSQTASQILASGQTMPPGWTTQQWEEELDKDLAHKPDEWYPTEWNLYQAELKKRKNAQTASVVPPPPLPSTTRMPLPQDDEIERDNVGTVRDPVPGQQRSSRVRDVSLQASRNEEALYRAFEPVTPTVSKTEMRAIENYQGSGYIDMNEAARNIPRHGIAQIANVQLNRIRQLDAAIGKSQVPSDLMLFRGVSGHSDFTIGIKKAIRDGNLVPGSTLTDHGFSSSTMNDRRARLFAGSEGILFEIETPRGSYGLYINEARRLFGRHQGTGMTEKDGFYGEQEVLLPRGTTIEILEIRREAGKPIVIRARVIDQSPQALKALRLLQEVIDQLIIEGKWKDDGQE